MNTLTIRNITWNLHGSFPDGRNEAYLKELLTGAKKVEKPDIFTVSFQELNCMPQNMVNDTLLVGEDPWTKAFRFELSLKGYIKIGGVRLMGTSIAVFVLKKHLLHIREIETQYTRLGLWGYWGNKGAVSTRFKLYGVSFCFVNAHMSAHDHLLENRVQEYNYIIDNHKFSSSPETSNILYHDYIVWQGDLNFRLMEGSFEFPEISQMIRQERYAELLAQDQLTRMRKEGRAFSELRENLPEFPPTYKFKSGFQEYDPKRRPAWTDRILFRCNADNYDSATLRMQQLVYTSLKSVIISDHEPVMAEFEVDVFQPDSSIAKNIKDFGASVVFQDPCTWFVQEDGYCLYNVNENALNLTSSWDWIGLYHVNFSDISDFYAFTWASSNREPGVTKSVVISDISLNLPGEYVLVYVTAKKSIWGMSSPFWLRPRYGRFEEAAVAETFYSGDQAEEAIGT